ncbi:YwiC-like family protein [Marinicrinis lubricantis]|uniref:YwiC-like family protein n=1 Tax=Marinicrinis lubricantis TaxID=2086470 RepID=A0ABW1IQ74_9BACL
MKKRIMVLPHEHGGWAMVSVPFFVGMSAGGLSWIHIPLFLAWLLFYLASYPLLQSIKKRSNRAHLIRWGTGYGILGLACAAFPLVQKPELFYFAPVMFILLSVNMWHVKHRKEREIINDLCAILLFSVGAAAAYLAGSGQWDYTLVAVTGFSFLQFAGSAFFVKTIFRERGSVRWSVIARLYHAVLLFIPWLTGYPWMIFAYLYSSTRAILLAGKSMRAWKAGIIEIIGSILFLIVSVIIL